MNKCFEPITKTLDVASDVKEQNIIMQPDYITIKKYLIIIIFLSVLIIISVLGKK